MLEAINAEKCELEDIRDTLASAKVALEEELTLSRRHLEENDESLKASLESCSLLKV